MSVFPAFRTHSGFRPRAAGGFTLIELMIALSVVAILAAIAYPTYTDSVRKARRAQAKADLVVLAQRAERFYSLNNSYAGFWATVGTTDRKSPRDGTAYYTLARTPDDSSPTQFTLTATPQSTQTADRGCGVLSIDQAGTRSISGTLEKSRCW